MPTWTQLSSPMLADVETTHPGRENPKEVSVDATCLFVWDGSLHLRSGGVRVPVRWQNGLVRRTAGLLGHVCEVCVTAHSVASRDLNADSLDAWITRRG